jgi:hypothetical protein
MSTETGGRDGWFSAESWVRTEETLAGWPVTVVTYRLRDVWHCKVDNVSPGAIIARATGATLEEARAAATGTAESRLKKTRRTGAGG